ncbi:MAG TPA: hypothetical protein DEO62_05615 [Lachnospiraceae bacterium]|nr:hypothetical protein [Lachnospiraceae bacterium]HBR04670.1 hypothetical protein [Lachnospiraceae bacterium]HBZ90480.1 hypothetical protein [Lachnospiraceae bacterium]
MKRCESCNMYIYDDTELCPMCNSVLSDVSEKDKQEVIKKYGRPAPYPDIKERSRKLAFAMKLILFIFILAGTAMIIVNAAVTPQMWWSLIAVSGLVYIYLGMRYWIRHDSGISSKLGKQILITIPLLIIIDYYTGFHKWSLTWAVPGIIILGNVIVMFLMLFYRDRWYAYLMLLLMLLVCCAVVSALMIFNLVTNNTLIYVADGITCTYLLAVIIFFGRTFRREMKRRFRV